MAIVPAGVGPLMPAPMDVIPGAAWDTVLTDTFLQV